MVPTMTAIPPISPTSLFKETPLPLSPFNKLASAVVSGEDFGGRSSSCISPDIFKTEFVVERVPSPF